ncbi:uncharacterized protein LOC127786688 [Diospyros lotus]|uniref:uncharacterized protein LOC127786688 n=1 Tax=Diospyros lotus TaxID=55363 RepID=UPI002255B86D|nr:uncharacterized protein LOC127786688 [Diospyros lotus]XP_052170228.1 uncharacterized protein LOC127786688 [Diospyros lotus]
MSRCFPFPPPGYEKAGLGDTGLLTKEKHKEKKSKKDQKSKEKKERKKDKERSDGKHKEKKDRKEKHKDRKDNDRDKEKEKTLDEKNTSGQQVALNGQKLGSDNLHRGHATETKFLLELDKRIRDEGGARENQVFQSNTVIDQRSIEYPGVVVERKIGSSEGKEKYRNKRENRVFQSNTVTEQRNVEHPGVVVQSNIGSNEGKEKYRNKRENRVFQSNTVTDQGIVDHPGVVMGSNVGSNEGKEKYRNKRENQVLQSNAVTDQRIVDHPGVVVESNTGSNEGKEKYRNKREKGVFQRNTVMDQRNVEHPGVVLESSIGSNEGKERYRNKREDDKNVNGQKNKIEAMGTENAFLRDSNAMSQKSVGVAGSTDKDDNKQRKKKEKHKHEDTDSKGEKSKDRDNQKKSKSKDKGTKKEKDKEEKAKGKEPNKEQPLLRVSSKEGMDSCNIKHPNLLKESTYNGNLGKRKELEINGFVHDDDILPNKLPRSMTSSHQPVENGRKLEASKSTILDSCGKQAVVVTNHEVEVKVSSGHQILHERKKLEPNSESVWLASERQRAASSGKIDQETKINGVLDAQQINACSSKPVSAPLRVKEKVEASAKLAHRDSKYLSEILSVPKVAEWLDFDDQEWLFSRDNFREEKEKGSRGLVDGTPQVWAEALTIETADITALPYVVPY